MLFMPPPVRRFFPRTKERRRKNQFVFSEKQILKIQYFEKEVVMIIITTANSKLGRPRT